MKKIENEKYTLIKNSDLDSVIALEKHLAYAMVLNENKSYENSIIEDLKISYNFDFKDLNNIISEKIQIQL